MLMAVSYRRGNDVVAAYIGAGKRDGRRRQLRSLAEGDRGREEAANGSCRGGRERVGVGVTVRAGADGGGRGYSRAGGWAGVVRK